MMSDPGGLALVSLLLPAISFLILAIVAPLRRLGRPAAYTSILFAAGALVAAFFSWRGHAGGQITKQVWDWLPSDGTSLAAIGDPRRRRLDVDAHPGDARRVPGAGVFARVSAR